MVSDIKAGDTVYYYKTLKSYSEYFIITSGKKYCYAINTVGGDKYNNAGSGLYTGGCAASAPCGYTPVPFHCLVFTENIHKTKKAAKLACKERDDE